LATQSTQSLPGTLDSGSDLFDDDLDTYQDLDGTLLTRYQDGTLTRYYRENGKGKSKGNNQSQGKSKGNNQSQTYDPDILYRRQSQSQNANENTDIFTGPTLLEIAASYPQVTPPPPAKRAKTSKSKHSKRSKKGIASVTPEVVTATDWITPLKR